MHPEHFIQKGLNPLGNLWHGMLDGHGARMWKTFLSWLRNYLAMWTRVCKPPGASGSILVSERIWEHNRSVPFQISTFIHLWFSSSKVKKKTGWIRKIWILIAEMTPILHPSLYPNPLQCDFEILHILISSNFPHLESELDL